MPGIVANIRIPPRGNGKTRHRAVVVGIDDYADAALHLPFCVADATRMDAVLTGRGYRVTALHGPPGVAAMPTRANVLRAIEQMVTRSDEDDLIMFYASCHGALIDRRPYLLMADTPNTPAGIIAGGHALSAVLAALRGRPRWIAVLLDVCHMGIGLDPATAEATDDTVARAGGFALLAGSTEAQIAQDTANAGIFSKYLADGLAGAADDVDGGLRFSALARHVQSGVARWRKSKEGSLKLSTQTPVLRLEVADLPLVPARPYRELAVQLPGKITCAAFSPDGRRLATGAADRTVRLWDPATGRPMLEPMAHDDDVRGVAFSTDGHRLYTGSGDGVTRTWFATTAKPDESAPVPLRSPVNAVAWSNDGLCRIAAADDGLHVEDVSELLYPVGRRRLGRKLGPIYALAFTAEMWELVTGGHDGRLLRWSTLGGAPSVEGKHEGPIWAVAVAPDGRHLAAGGADYIPTETLRNVARIWDLESEVVVPLVGHRAAVTGIAYQPPDGRLLATSCYDGIVRLWDAASGQLVRELTIVVDGRRHHSEAYGVAFSPRGDLLFAGYADGRGCLFDVEDVR